MKLALHNRNLRGNIKKYNISKEQGMIVSQLLQLLHRVGCLNNLIYHHLVLVGVISKRVKLQIFKQLIQRRQQQTLNM